MTWRIQSGLKPLFNLKFLHFLLIKNSSSDPTQRQPCAYPLWARLTGCVCVNHAPAGGVAKWRQTEARHTVGDFVDYSFLCKPALIFLWLDDERCDEDGWCPGRQMPQAVRYWDGWWHHRGLMDMSWSKSWEMVKDRRPCRQAISLVMGNAKS